MKKKIIVAVSGGFDPVHIGHTRLFKEARDLGDELVVILNNDNWLKKKKGFTLMSENERKEIIESLKSVDRVVITKHPENPEDMSVCAELADLKPDIFAKGGDRDKKDAQKTLSSSIPTLFTATTCIPFAMACARIISCQASYSLEFNLSF